MSSTTPVPLTVPLPAGPPEGMSTVAWLAIGTGTALAMLLGAWGIKRLAERDEKAPDTLHTRVRF